MKFLRTRKSVLLLLVTCITLLLSGCGNSIEIHSDAATYSQSKTTQSSGTKSKSNKENDKKEETTEIETIEPPEDGWTVEELVNTIYFNEKPIHLPLRISDLGEKYDFGKDDVYFSGTSAGVSLSYDNKIIAVVTLENCLKLEDVYDSNVSTIILPSLNVDKSRINHITINGLSLSSSIDDVISCLGKPQQTDIEKDSGVLIYNVRDTEDCLMTIHYKNNELIYFFIHIN